MWHIFGHHLSTAFDECEKGNLDGAKEELENITKDGQNIKKEIGQLVHTLGNFEQWIGRAHDCNNVADMKDAVTEAQLALTKSIEKMKKILKEEMKER